MSWDAGAAETYVYFDRATQTLSTQRESLRVAWFASAGELATESNGRAENDDAAAVANAWSAPAVPGAAHLWVVLRDSRGGIDFAAYDVTVVP